MRRPFALRQFVMVFAGTLVAVLVIRETDLVAYLSYAIEKGRLQALSERVPSEALVEELSRPTRMVADLVAPAVVHIETRRRINLRDFAAATREFAGDSGFLEAHPWFLGEGPPADDSDGHPYLSGLGSGFIFDAEHGYILTNYHVAEGADLIEVILHDGRRYEATLVGADPQSDLAILSSPAEHLHQLEFGDSRRLAVGDDVFALGNPFGLSGTFSRGIVSG
ncbi:MAG: trypsin-like peptidase domain-containing protein, partial [Phycisphaerae bacterium]